MPSIIFMNCISCSTTMRRRGQAEAIRALLDDAAKRNFDSVLFWALDSAPALLLGINELYVHWRNTTDGDHSSFCSTCDDSIIVRRTSHSPNALAYRPAIDLPVAKDHRMPA